MVLRREALELLSEVVARNHRDGRRSFAASLKPEMRRRSLDGFDEQRLGFSSFRRFLDYAVDEGAVELRAAPRGPDVVVVPIGGQPLASELAPGTARKIRGDIWDAFLDWTQGFTRLWDDEDKRAYRIPAERVPLSQKTCVESASS